MVHFDNICLAARNAYEATSRLSRETGLGSYDGGFFPKCGLGHKVIPLARDIYVEVEGVVDHMELRNNNPVAKLYEEQTLEGDRFLGWCLRADTMEEMERFAAHHGTTVDTRTLGQDTARHMMNGNRRLALQTPSALVAWPKGKCNLYYKPPGSIHPADHPVEPGTGTRVGQELAWTEVGEAREALVDWLGDLVAPDSFPFEVRYNGQVDGLHAVRVKTSNGVVEVRRAPPKTR